MTLAKDLRAGLSIGIVLLIAFLLLGCGSERARPEPDVRLTGPDHVRVLPDGTVTEVGELEGLLRRRGYDKETTRELLQDARRQQEAYEAGQRRVKARQGPTPTEEEVVTAARVIFSETKDRAVMSYVASTVRARLESDVYPNDVWQVTTQSGQYSGYDSPQDRRQLRRLTPKSRSRSFQQALRAAWFALNAPREMLPAGAKATHFVHVDTQRRMGRDMPAWAQVYPEQFRAYDNSGQSKVVFYRKPS